jgi:hypothetical protein
MAYIDPFEPVPAMVCEHVDPDAIAKEIKHDLKLGIEHYRELGLKFLKCKDAVTKATPGGWKAWIERQRFSCGYRQIARYMKLAKSDVTSHLEEAWGIINGNADAEIDAEDMPVGTNLAHSQTAETKTSEPAQCPACARKKRLNQALPKKCADCAALRDVEPAKGKPGRTEKSAGATGGGGSSNSCQTSSKPSSNGTPAGSTDNCKCPTCKGKGEVKKTHPAMSKFVPPTLDEITGYCLDRKNKIDPEQFWAHYESNGWKVGKVPMKSWKGAVITWEKNHQEGNYQSNGNGRPHKETPGEIIARLRKEQAQCPS